MNSKYDFDTISFGMRLTEIRKFYGRTQEEIADKVGVSVKSVQNWENGSKMPTVDNIVALAMCYGMTVGEIIEDESYRIFKKKADCRKHSIEIIEVANRLEVFVEFAEDRFYDRYEAWVWDELSLYKYMFASSQKLISYEQFKTGILEQADEMVEEYRKWLFENADGMKNGKGIKSQLEKKIKCESLGMADNGATFVDGIVLYSGDEI